MNGTTTLCAGIGTAVLLVVGAMGKDTRATPVLNDAPLPRIATELAEAFGRAVSFEDRRPVGRGQDATPQPAFSELRASLKADYTTLTGSLARVSQSVHGACWSIDPVTGMANLHPTTNGWCEWILPAKDIEGKTFREILIEDDLLGLREHGIRFSVGRGSHSWLNKKVSLRIRQGMSARNALNVLCALFPPGMRWQVMTEQRSGVAPYGLLRFEYFEAAQDRSERQELNRKWREWRARDSITKPNGNE